MPNILTQILAPPILWRFGAGDVDPITIDCVLSYEINHDYEVTQNPVEEGVDVVDHKRKRPLTIHMNGMVSDSPNNVLDVLHGNIGGLLGSEIDPSLGGPVQSRSQVAYKALQALADSKTPFSMVTPRDLFRDMVFASFRPSKNDAGLYLGFDATLQQIRFARTSTSAVFASSPVKATAVPKKAQILRPGGLVPKTAATAFLEFIGVLNPLDPP